MADKSVGVPIDISGLPEFLKDWLISARTDALALGIEYTEIRVTYFDVFKDMTFDELKRRLIDT